ncbi:MAG: ferric reductase-like transmembrane domain-containing protein [bacterium]|nr:ferric reductase-like transmembrane domain-containing protein [bacterium]
MPAELKAQIKVQAHIEQGHHTNDQRMWIEMIVYSIILLIVISGYYFVQSSSFTGQTVNRIVADLSILLIGISLILSSVCYFWNFADKYIIYRKHMGLVGVGYMILHIVLSTVLPNYAPFPGYYLTDARIMSFTAAVLGTIIFALMGIASNRFAIQEIGPQLWRKLMRVGFIGFAFTLYHFSSKGMPYWSLWFMGESRSVIPSFGLIVFMFGLVVIGLRIALWVATANKHPEV